MGLVCLSDKAHCFFCLLSRLVSPDAIHDIVANHETIISRLYTIVSNHEITISHPAKILSVITAIISAIADIIADC